MGPRSVSPRLVHGREAAKGTRFVRSGHQDYDRSNSGMDLGVDAADVGFEVLRDCVAAAHPNTEGDISGKGSNIRARWICRHGVDGVLLGGARNFGDGPHWSVQSGGTKMDGPSGIVERVAAMRPNRRTGIWAVLALIAGVLAVSAGTAGAGSGGPSAAGVQPDEVSLGGQPNDCDTSEVASAADYELRIENPQDDQIYEGIEGISFRLDVVNDELLDFTVIGPAVVFDVIIKGGQKSTHYDYDGSSVGAVTSDQELHAPTKGNGSNLFSISHTSICYQEAVALEGTVFVDANQNGENDGESADVPRVITAYSGSTSVASTSSASNGTYTLYVTPGGTYTVCEEAIDDFVQTAPDNTLCTGLGDSEVGGYPVSGVATTDLDFGNAPEICGQFLDDQVGIFDADFELFDQGNAEVGCDNKIGQLSITGSGEATQVNLPLVGSGEVAGIGIITKTFGSPDNFVPLEYAQSPTDAFEVLPWCVLRGKGDGDGNQFDPYLPSGQYPSLLGVTDPLSGDDSVSCKVYVDENAEGIQTTVVLIQDDPFWR